MCEDPSASQRLSLSIFKFGGSCFKDKSAFEHSLTIVQNYAESPLIIVCSALQGITDKLLEMGNQIVKNGSLENVAELLFNEIQTTHFDYLENLFDSDSEYSSALSDFLKSSFQKITDFVPQIVENGMIPKNSDWLVSFGERMSSMMYAQYLNSNGYDAQFLSTDENFIITDENFGNALPLLDLCETNTREKLIPLLNSSKILIIPGFYGSTQSGEITTLGRGGSDFTATIIAYALSNDFDTKVIFWKDVQGILSCNPKLVPHAKLLHQISYTEAKELAYFGSKILHPKCLKMAEQRDIPTEIHCFTDPFSENFTQITKECIIPQNSVDIIKGIASMDRIAMVTVQSDAMISLPGSAAHIFSLMGENSINIIFISQSSSENNITFGTNPENGFKAGQLLAQDKFFGKEWFKVIVEHDSALISVIGAGMVHKPGVAGLLFTTLGNNNINIRAIAQGSAETNITMVIEAEQVPAAVNIIYNAFINGQNE